MTTTAPTFEDPSPADLGQTDEPTVRAITSRLRQIGSKWAARIIEIDAGLGRLEPDDSYRGKQIQTLRDYADLLEANPSLENGIIGQVHHNIYGSGEHSKEIIDRMREIRRIYGGSFEKSWDDHPIYPEFKMIGKFGTFQVRIGTNRNNVCEQVVVGKKTEVVREPDPELVAEATASIPIVEREVEIDITEWICPEGIA